MPKLTKPNVIPRKGAVVAWRSREASRRGWQWLEAEARRLGLPEVARSCGQDGTIVLALDDDRVLKLRIGGRVGIYALALREQLPGVAPVHAVGQVQSHGYAIVATRAEPVPSRLERSPGKLYHKIKSRDRDPWLQSAREALAALEAAGVRVTDPNGGNWGTLDGRAVLVDLGQRATVPLPEVPRVEAVEDVIAMADGRT